MHKDKRPCKSKVLSLPVHPCEIYLVQNTTPYNCKLDLKYVLICCNSAAPACRFTLGYDTVQEVNKNIRHKRRSLWTFKIRSVLNIPSHTQPLHRTMPDEHLIFHKLIKAQASGHWRTCKHVCYQRYGPVSLSILCQMSSQAYASEIMPSRNHENTK